MKLIKHGDEKDKYNNFVENIRALKEAISIEKSFHKIRQLMEIESENVDLQAHSDSLK